MKLLRFCVLALIFFPCASSGQGNYWQQELRYAIDVSLHDADHTLDGFLQLEYINHSPDTLRFIWFHLWPNAYKNDRTAFSEQLVENGRTDFYFSDKGQRGYINRLDFRTGNTSLRTEDHPQYIDVMKVILSKPLLPGDSTVITTPFHVQLPFNFSRGGHVDHAYQVTQWYPKPAVYDAEGWHPMPYLDQGEFYSEFGSYEVHITLPKDYVVAATGELQGEDEKKWLLEKHAVAPPPPVSGPRVKKKKWGAPSGIKQPVNARRPDTATRTLVYRQDRVHDFAWFADKKFIVDHDTLQLASGRIIDAYTFYTPAEKKTWQYGLQYVKKAVRFRSLLMGEYPYNAISAVSAPMGFAGGMEYPTITAIASVSGPADLEGAIEHEVGHNWLYGVLASNERDHPWMDEGMNSYYDNRYKEQYGAGKKNTRKWLDKKLPSDPDALWMSVAEQKGEDQPVASSATEFTEENYYRIPYAKAARWMQQLEKLTGRSAFDSSMRSYYRQWQFRHPSPAAFRELMQQAGGDKVRQHFALLYKKGPLTPVAHKKIRPALLFNFNHTDSISYINIGPMLGYNQYDKVMVGGMIHNYDLPAGRLRFVLVPLYATNSKTLNGLGRVGYSWHSGGQISQVEIAAGGARFSTNESLDTIRHKVFENFYKIVPSVRISFRHPPRSHTTSWIDWRTYLVNERRFSAFREKNNVFYPVASKNDAHYINQLSAGIASDRILYPYDYMLQLQQGKGFYRINLTGSYFFNYSKGGGMAVRLFAAKFGYAGSKTADAYRYQPALITTGEDDYTYSDYFVGRSASLNNPVEPLPNKGLGAHQVMIRDGGFKLRTDQFSFLQGRSENWVAAINLNTTLPNGLFPVKLPLRIFLDAGTYAEAWKKKDAPTSHFLYVAGLQLSLFRDVLNIYAPVFYSSEYSDNLKTFPDQDTFFKRITFSIDIRRVSLQKLTGNRLPF